MKEVTDADRDIGRRIKEARLAQRVSAKTLGAAVNVTFQQMQKYETGINRISASRLVSVARALNVPITDLLEDGEPSSSALPHSPKARALALAFDRLPETVSKKRLYALVLSLVDDLGAEAVEQPAAY